MRVNEEVNNEERYYLIDEGEKKYLSFVEEEKDLVVNFDKKLNFKNHIHKRIKQANKMMGLVN